jgi:hypothetical protein
MYQMKLSDWQKQFKSRSQLLYNCSEYSHLNDELVPFPIGMSWQLLGYNGSLADIQLGPHHNNILCAVGYGSDERRRPTVINRASILNTLSKNGIHNTYMPSTNYLRALPNYKFVVSPEGNGIDCHRHYEALMAGCIPIIERNEHIVSKYGNCPILYTDDYSEITGDYLSNAYEEMLHKTWDFSRLCLNTYDIETQEQIKANGNYWGNELCKRKWYN